MSTFFDRTRDIKEQWQKDLARVYKDTYDLLVSHFAPLTTIPPEVMEELSDPNCPKIYKVTLGLVQNSVQIISTNLLYSYLNITRPILFGSGMMDIKSLANNEFFSSATPTAEEIYDGLRMICPVAVPLLIEKISGCPLSVKEQLKKAFHEQRRDDFVECINNLDCDISILQFYAVYLPFERWIYITMFTNPQAYLDLVYHRNLGRFSEIFRDSIPSEQEMREIFDSFNDSSDVPLTAPPKGSTEYSQQQEEEAITNAEQMKALIIEILKMTTHIYKKFEDVLFPFEKEYYTNLLELPYIRKAVEEIEEELRHEDEEEAVKDSASLEQDEGNCLNELHWPMDEELKNYPNNYNDADYFTNTIFGPAGKVDLGGVEKLFAVLVKQGILKDDIETKLIFLARYSGKEIPGITLKPIEWDMLDNDREKAIGYLIYRTTTNHEFVKGTHFFYFDFNGDKKTPKYKAIAQGAHSWVKRERKTSFEIDLNAFLQKYLEKGDI